MWGKTMQFPWQNWMTVLPGPSLYRPLEVTFEFRVSIATIRRGKLGCFFRPISCGTAHDRHYFAKRSLNAYRRLVIHSRVPAFKSIVASIIFNLMSLVFDWPSKKQDLQPSGGNPPVVGSGHPHLLPLLPTNSSPFGMGVVIVFHHSECSFPCSCDILL